MARRMDEGADGRNQVIAGCGNGSLRLFDITLEVCPHPFSPAYKEMKGVRG